MTPAREIDAKNVILPDVMGISNPVLGDSSSSDSSSAQLCFDQTVYRDPSRNKRPPSPLGGIFEGPIPISPPAALGQRSYQNPVILLSSQPAAESQSISVNVNHERTHRLVSSDDYLQTSDRAQTSSLSDASSSQAQLENEQDLLPGPDSSKFKSYRRILTPPTNDEWKESHAQPIPPQHPPAPLLFVAQTSQIPPPGFPAVAKPEVAIRNSSGYYSSQINQEVLSDSNSTSPESAERKLPSQPHTSPPEEYNFDSVTTSEESSPKPHISPIHLEPNLQTVPEFHLQPRVQHSTLATSVLDRNLSDRGLSKLSSSALNMGGHGYDSGSEDSLAGSDTPRPLVAQSWFYFGQTHPNGNNEGMPGVDIAAILPSNPESRESRGSPASQSSSLQANNLPPVNSSPLISLHSPSGQYKDTVLPPPPPIPDKFRIVPRSALKQGGNFFKRARSAVPARVEVTADDLLPQNIKKVTFSEPTPTTDPNLDIRHSRRYQRYLESTIAAGVDVSVCRNQVEIERRNFVQNREHLIEILKKMLGRSNEDMDEESEENKFDSEEAILNNWATFKQQAILIVDSEPQHERLYNHLKRLELNLAERDSVLREKELLALSKSRGIKNPEPQANVIFKDDVSNETPSAHSADSEETAATVREYYDKIGETNLTRDYIHNLDTEFIQLAIARQNRRAAGEKLDLSDEEFRHEYYRERSQLYLYYQTTKSEIESLYKKSMDRNYDIERPNLPPEDPDEHPKLDPQLVHNAWSRVHMGEHSDDETNAMTSIIRPKVQDPIARSKSLILTWRREVEKSYVHNDIQEGSLGSYSPVWSDSNGLNEEGYMRRDKSDEDVADTRFGVDHSKLQRRYSDPDIRDTPPKIRPKRRMGQPEQLRVLEWEQQHQMKRSISASRIDARYSQGLLY
jgi:hypothetical protein